ncbi:quinon protein alcohol dehydrogenase-like superfamily [Mycena pura]|uniref:Quinon protein alcohol dehydrogenase-like superfamily n=1 Tax=Mycena pura TaxID=153505 RepID=A0AAD6UUW9_9AGAR|nr:quinon protein alcohol dehydrogenase-like superfamily [Mycena pura]
MRADVRNGRALLGSVPGFESRAFSNDGRALLYLPADRKDVVVLDVATLTERFRLSGHTDAIVWAETSPDDKIVATSSWDKTVRIWSMDSAETLHVLQGATNQSWAGAFSPDGELIAAGAGDKMVRIWNVGTGELLHTLSGFTAWVRGLSFSPDGLCLAAGARGGTLRVFDLKSGDCLQNWQIDTDSSGVNVVALSLDGTLIAIGAGPEIHVYDASTSQRLQKTGGHAGEVTHLEFHPSGRKLIVATTSWDKTVRIWSMDSAETLHILQGTNQSWAGAFSPDGELIAAGAGDKMVRIWNVGTGELLHTLSGFTGWIRSLSFSPDGLCLAAGAAGGTLRVFDRKSGDCLQNWQIDVTDAGARSFLEISRVQYTTRGDLFFKSTEGRIFGYSAAKNLKWETKANTRSAAFSISSDGSKIIAALGSSIGVWKID